jgi:hypothetical protein
LLVVTDGQRNRVADIAQFTGFGPAELHAAGDVPVMNIQAWDYALCQHANIH